MNYAIGCYFIILAVFWIRGAYTYYKFVQYCKTHYPKEASEFLCLGTITSTKTLFKKHEISDLEFITLKNKAKNAYISACCAFFFGILFILILMVIFYILDT